MRARLEPGRVLALQGFWEIAAFVTNVWLFLLVGIQLSGDLLLREAWPIALAVIALHVGRAVAVYGIFGALHLAGEGVSWRWQHVMVFGNVKGALSMAAVLALPQHPVSRAADRDRLRRHAASRWYAGAAVPAFLDLAGRGGKGRVA